MAVRMITIPVSESLPVGDLVTLQLSGRVIGVARSAEAPGWVEATIEISDPAVASTEEGLDQIMDRWHQPRPRIRSEERFAGGDL